MEIIWHGQSCFTFKGEDSVLVTDPCDDTDKLKGDVVTIGHDNFMKNQSNVEGDPRVFSWPGEYEAKGILFNGIAIPGQEGLIFHFEMDNIKIAHLGGLNQKLNEETIEQLGDVDILLIPVGGDDGLDPKMAHEVIEQVDPRVVIPMNYENVDAFLKEVGSHTEAQESFKIKGRTGLPEETTEFVVLSRSRSSMDRTRHS